MALKSDITEGAIYLKNQNRLSLIHKNCHSKFNIKIILIKYLK